MIPMFSYRYVAEGLKLIFYSFEENNFHFFQILLLNIKYH